MTGTYIICKQAIGEIPGWNLKVIRTTHEKCMSLRASVNVGKTKKGKARRTSFLSIPFNIHLLH